MTVIAPVCAPSVVGVKVTRILQFAPAANVVGAIGQVVEVSAKFPETEMLLTVSGELRVFVSVTPPVVLVVSTTQFPNVSPVGFNVCA